MRIDRFQEHLLSVYNATSGVQAETWSDGTKRPSGMRIKLPNGTEVRHALTRVRVPDEDLDAPEEPVLGDPPPELPVPSPSTPAEYLAAVLANSGNQEMARVWVYESAERPGLGVEFHSGAKIHMLLV